MAASLRGDAQRVVDLLDKGTKNRLIARAREASDLAGGGVVLEPKDLLAVGFESSTMEVAEVQSKGDPAEGRATVVVKSTDGRAVEVRVTREEGLWKVVLDL